MMPLENFACWNVIFKFFFLIFHIGKINLEVQL